MEWTDEAVLLSMRRHGESAAVASVLTRDHGRHAGLIPGGFGRRHRGSLQPGNLLHLTWRGRLPEQLGHFAWEVAGAHGGSWLDDPDRLAALSSCCALVEATLPEREPHPATFEGLASLLAGLAEPGWPGAYVRWEVALLADLGYGLDLESCAATGSNDQLAYVSPRTGRAISLAAGEPWRDRLLALPPFLVGDHRFGQADIAAGLALTGHFLERWVFGAVGRALPPSRSRLVERMRA